MRVQALMLSENDTICLTATRISLSCSAWLEEASRIHDPNMKTSTRYVCIQENYSVMTDVPPFKVELKG